MQQPESATTRPLCVDLDGTLIRDDVLWLSLVLGIKSTPGTVMMTLVELLFGRKAAAKQRLARQVVPNPAILLYQEPVLRRIKAAQAAGQPVWLVTATDRQAAERIAQHVGGFTRVLASDGCTNLRGARKAERLKRETGSMGYDYIGNDRSDFPVWRSAQRVGMMARTPAAAAAMLREFPGAEITLPEGGSGRLATLAGLLRVRQWSKNLLVLVPLFTAHRWNDTTSWIQAGRALAVFCLGCSAVYIVNDLLDLPQDRRHPSKKRRPLARGAATIPQGLAIAVVLFAGSSVLAGLLPAAFQWTWAAYLGSTFVYSLWLKHRLLVDAFLLSAFYVLRVVAGAAAVAVPLSNWLLSFSAFTFLSLSLLKRYGEITLLSVHRDGLPPRRQIRAYQSPDATLLCSLGAGCAIGAAVMLALFVDSSAALGVYAHPQFLWLGCPVFLFWLARLWLLANRGVKVDDPIAFALTDRVSYGAAVTLAIAFILSL